MINPTRINPNKPIAHWVITGIGCLDFSDQYIPASIKSPIKPGPVQCGRVGFSKESAQKVNIKGRLNQSNKAATLS